MVMSGLQIADLTAVGIDPMVHLGEPTFATSPDSSPLEGRTVRVPFLTVADRIHLETPDNAGAGNELPCVTDLVIDPFNAVSTTQFDEEWCYVPVRRTALVEELSAADAGAANVIYMSTSGGGAGASTDAFYGTGVYKSTDSGKTWTQIDGETLQSIALTRNDDNASAQAATGRVTGIAADPTDGDSPSAPRRLGPYFDFQSQRLAAPSGDASANSAGGGVWKTRDGGLS